MKKTVLIVAVISALALVVSPALAQSFNITFGTTATPNNTYGAAAGQAGYWNLAVGVTLSLADLAGGSTGVTLSHPGAGWTDFFDHPGTTGDDANLLDDFYTWPPSGPLLFTVVGLAPGSYKFFSYSFAPNGANSYVDTAGSPEGFQLLGGTWLGSHQLGVTYALHTVSVAQPGDAVTVTVGAWNGAWGGFNGLQIVQVPEPASLSLLASGLVIFLRRHPWGLGALKQGIC